MTAIEKEIARLRRENNKLRAKRGVAQPTVQYERPAVILPPVVKYTGKAKNAKVVAAHEVNREIAAWLRVRGMDVNHYWAEATFNVREGGLTPEEAVALIPTPAQEAEMLRLYGAE